MSNGVYHVVKAILVNSTSIVTPFITDYNVT